MLVRAHSSLARIQALLNNIRQRKQKSDMSLVAEADALVRLNTASSRLWRLQNLSEGLNEMRAATIELLNADMAKVQLLEVERGVLTIAAQQGFEREYIEFFREVSVEDNSAS